MTAMQSGARRNRQGRPPHLTESVAGRLRADFVDELKANQPLPGERVLAERYGVSRATVRAALKLLERGRVIRRKPGQSSRVAESGSWQALRAAGKQLGCSFATNPSSISDSTKMDLFEGLLAARTGFDILWVNSDWRAWRREEPKTHFDLPSLMGVFLFGRHVDETWRSLAPLGKPLICLDYDASAEGLDSFCFDNRRAGGLLAQRLFRLGHRRVVGVFESPDKPEEKQDAAWRERRAGFLSAWEKLGGEKPNEIFLSDRGEIGAVPARFADLLRLPAASRPTAAIAPTAGFLAPLRDVARSFGLNVPQDISVVGFAGKRDVTELTAIRFDGRKVGLAAALHMEKLVWQRRFRCRKPIVKRFKGSYAAGKTHARAPIKKIY